MRKRSEIICDACGQDEFQFLFHHHNNWSVKRCISCGLAQVMPRPTKKEVLSLYHEDMEHFAPYIDQLSVHQAYFRDKVAEIKQIIDEHRKATSHKPQATSHKPQATSHTLKLLDIGCAMGVLIGEANKQGIHAEGLDISEDAVSFCRKHGMRVYPGTLQEFAKKNKHKKNDIITAFEIIEHEYSPKIMIETMLSMLNPRGIAVITTPNHNSVWRKVMGKYWPGYQHPEHLFFFDQQSLFNLFMHIGFTTVTVRKDDNRPFPLSFLFTRGADYFPIFAPILRGLGRVTRPLPFTNPLNPWDDVIVYAHT
jgi:2-polyprenyl-3-methyl-5-hydroxy-6-metoxy-1,4-benzoquinol methylase